MPETITQTFNGNTRVKKAVGVNDRVIVKPINKLKKKNRNRVGTVIELEDHMMPSWAIVLFDDTKRENKVDTFDLEIYNES